MPHMTEREDSMTILYYEVKKLLLIHKGLLFILLCLAAMTISLFLTDRPANEKEERYAQEYTFYLEQLKGAYSNEKERFLEEEALRIQEADMQEKELYEEYYNGNLSEDEFGQRLSDVEEILLHRDGFEVVYDQFLFIKENPENRYFMATNGWTGLLDDKMFHLFLMIAILFLATPAFCYEYGSRMEVLVLTSPGGEGNYHFHKFTVVLAGTAAVSMLSTVIRYAFYRYRYGLADGSFPVQSLKLYAGGMKELSVMEAFWMISALRLFGCLFYAVCIMLLSVLARKYAITVFACASMVLLPYFGLEERYWNVFPLPPAFLQPAGFLKGDMYEWNPVAREYITRFKEIGSDTLVLLTAFSLVLCVLFSISIFYKNRNHWSRRRGYSVNKKTGLALLVCLGILFMGGCAPDIQTDCLYNTAQRMSYDTEDYRFFADLVEGKSLLAAQNRSTGQVTDLVRNPLKSLIRVEQALFGRGDKVYYILYEIDKSKFHGEDIKKMSVMEVDSTTFNEKIIFEKNVTRKKEYFLGFDQSENLEWQFLHASYAFFLNDRYLYFAGDELRQIDRRTGEVEVLTIPVTNNIGFDGRFIYYINERLVFSTYDTETQIHREIPEIVTSGFLIDRHEILFINRKDGGRLYSAKRDGTGLKKLSDEGILWFEYDEEYIYYQGKTWGRQQLAREHD